MIQAWPGLRNFEGLRHRQGRGMQTHMMQAVLDPARPGRSIAWPRRSSSSATGVDWPSPAAVSPTGRRDPSRLVGLRTGARRRGQRFRRAEISAPLRAAAIRSGCFSATAPSALVAESTASRSTASAWSNSSASGIASRSPCGPAACPAARQTSRSSRAVSRWRLTSLQRALRARRPAASSARPKSSSWCVDALLPRKRGRVGQLVRFVEDHRVGLGQQVGHSLFAQHQVGHEERVVDHHHVGVLRLASRLDHETVADARTFLAQAILARGGHALPDLGVFGYLRQIAPVAGLGDAGEHLDLAQLRDLGTRFQGALVALHAVQVIVADIVAAPLEQRGRHRRGQRRARAADRAKQLVLQRAGAWEISTLPPWMKAGTR